MFWDNASAVIDRIRSLFASVPLLLGLGFSRACLGWVLDTTKGFPAIDGNIILGVAGIGQIAGFIAIMAIVRSITSWTQHAPSVLLASFGSFLLGACLIFCSQVFLLGDGWAIAGTALACAGYAMMLSLWMELYGLFSAKKILMAFCLSYLVNFIIWWALRNMPLEASLLSCLLCAAISCFMLICGYSERGVDSHPTGKPSPKSIPWTLVLWLVVFSFAYSLADGITKMGHTTIPSKLGMAVPGIAVLLAVIIFSKQFGAKALFTGAFVLMVSGFGLSVFSGAPHWLAQGSMSAAIEAQQIVTVIFACQCARYNKDSATFYYALMHAITTIGTRLALLPVFTHLNDVQTAMLWIVIIALMAIACVALVVTKFFSGETWVEKTVDQGNTSLSSVVKKYNLTQRETTVFYLLMEGRSYEKIAEELFVAQGTVRAHVGHIFEKMSVHSRWELEQKIREGA